MSGGGVVRRRENRLMLAVALAQPSNFLVLDEPTNDLDMDTLDLLQEVLDDYQGTILIVSHDRDFLDRVVTSVIYMKGDGTVSEHAGSYSELLEKLRDSRKTPQRPSLLQKKPTRTKKTSPPPPNRPVTAASSVTSSSGCLRFCLRKWPNWKKKSQP